MSPVALEFFPGNPDRQYRQLRNFYLFWTVDHVMYRFAVIYSTSSLEHFDVRWDGTAGKPSRGMKAWTPGLGLDRDLAHWTFSQSTPVVRPV